MKLWGFGKHSKNKSHLERQNSSPKKRDEPKTFCCDACGKSYPYSLFCGVVTAPEYKHNQSNKLMEISGRLFPLEYKTSYVLCLSCTRQLDYGFGDSRIEAELDKVPAVWGVLTCFVDKSSKVEPLMGRQMNYVKPVNIMRLKVIKFIVATEAEKKVQKP